MAATPSPRDPSRHPGALRAWLVWWTLLAALWLALVDTVAVPELVAGAVLVRSRRQVLLRPRAAWAPAALRAMARFGPDLVPLATALWRRGVRRSGERGRLVEVPYGAVAEKDPEAAAHRVLTEAIGSFAPNSIVVDIDRERRVLLVHELVATDDPAARAAPLPEP